MENLKRSTTLIIHPAGDETTTFLEEIYSSIPDQKLIRDELNSEKLKKVMESHSRIIMLGHGTSIGLLSICTPTSFSTVVSERLGPPNA